MARIALRLEIPCTREEAARFAAVELFLDALQHDPTATPAAELEAIFGASAKDTILGLVGYRASLDLTCRFDPATGILTIANTDEWPNLAALPELLLWLYPEKLPLAYLVQPTDKPALAFWTIIGLSHIEIVQDGSQVDDRLEALRALRVAAGRLDLLPIKELPREEN